MFFVDFAAFSTVLSGILQDFQAPKLQIATFQRRKFVQQKRYTQQKMSISSVNADPFHGSTARR
jgi:hypothetical protein